MTAGAANATIDGIVFIDPTQSGLLDGRLHTGPCEFVVEFTVPGRPAAACASSGVAAQSHCRPGDPDSRCSRLLEDTGRGASMKRRQIALRATVVAVLALGLLAAPLAAGAQPIPRIGFLGSSSGSSQ